MPPPLALPISLFDLAVAHLTRCLPHEGVGYLAGPSGQAPTHWLPLVNELASPMRFRTTPESALAAHKLMRATATELQAIVHSHPASAPVPSRHDSAGNPFGLEVVWLIISFVTSPPEARAWRLTPHSHHPVDIVWQSC